MSRPVLPDVEPGYLHKLLPEEVPEQPEQWQEVMKDIERVIMPGVTNWYVKLDEILFELSILQ